MFQFLTKIKNYIFKNKSEVLFRHKLSEWNYLGYSIIQFVSGSTVTKSTKIHFFEGKGNETKKSWVMEPKDPAFLQHTWISSVHLWKANQLRLPYNVIQSFHSIYLEKKMKDSGYVWSDKDYCFTKIDNPGNVVAKEDNIIKVDFTNDKK